jgi:hypothetical protein
MIRLFCFRPTWGVRVYRSLLILTVLLLAGCTSAESQAQVKAEADARDDAKCKAYGYQSGTLNYSDCRDKLTEMRDQSDRGALAGRLLGRSPF